MIFPEWAWTMRDAESRLRGQCHHRLQSCQGRRGQRVPGWAGDGHQQQHHTWILGPQTWTHTCLSTSRGMDSSLLSPSSGRVLKGIFCISFEFKWLSHGKERKETSLSSLFQPIRAPTHSKLTNEKAQIFKIYLPSLLKFHGLSIFGLKMIDSSTTLGLDAISICPPRSLRSHIWTCKLQKWVLFTTKIPAKNSVFLGKQCPKTSLGI